MPVNTLITGASSGIGEALAVACAKRGDTLFLCGRDGHRLGLVAERCRAALSAQGGGEVRAEVVDVTDEYAVRSWIERCDSNSPLDRVFANAGVSTGEETERNVRATFATNVGGCVNTVLPALEIFRRRGASDGGNRQIVITASIAGYGPLGACPSYAATKACVKSWGLSLRSMYASSGVKVNVVCPGFVRSRITDANTCPMPFFLEADQAAETILRGVDRNRGLIAFPWQMRLSAWLLSVLPWRVNELANRLLPRKSR